MHRRDMSPRRRHTHCHMNRNAPHPSACRHTRDCTQIPRASDKCPYINRSRISCPRNSQIHKNRSFQNPSKDQCTHRRIAPCHRNRSRNFGIHIRIPHHTYGGKNHSVPDCAQSTRIPRHTMLHPHRIRTPGWTYRHIENPHISECRHMRGHMRHNARHFRSYHDKHRHNTWPHNSGHCTLPRCVLLRGWANPVPRRRDCRLRNSRCCPNMPPPVAQGILSMYKYVVSYKKSPVKCIM